MAPQLCSSESSTYCSNLLLEWCVDIRLHQIHSWYLILQLSSRQSLGHDGTSRKSEIPKCAPHAGPTTKEAVTGERRDGAEPGGAGEEEILESSWQMTPAPVVTCPHRHRYRVAFRSGRRAGYGDVVPKELVGFILLPIVGNCAQHATAIMASVEECECHLSETAR